MPTPTRPSTGGPVESSWGQEVHDGLFLPAGGHWIGTGAAVATGVVLPLAAVSDPGAWLSAPGVANLIVPPDGAGLYLIDGRLSASVGASGTLEINGEMLYGAGSYTFTALKSTFHYAAFSTVVPLVVGDLVRFRVNSPPAITWAMHFVRVVRIGATFGLP
jgi:hypothetical protein